MDEKQLYEQKWQAQLDVWQAEVDKFKAKASGASADAQLRLNDEIKVLQKKVDEGKAKLAQIAAASDDAWASLKQGGESAWTALKSAFSDAASKFKG
jgi:hypothetical protein